MNGKKARAIRKSVYPYSVSYDLRDFGKDQSGGLRAFGFRGKYKAAKKAFKEEQRRAK